MQGPEMIQDNWRVPEPGWGQEGTGPWEGTLSREEQGQE